LGKVLQETVDIINTEIPSNPIVGRYLSDMLVKLKRESYQDIYTFDEAILHLGQTGNAMIPVVEINEKSLKIEKAAVVKEYELIGFLETEELETIMLLLNPTTASISYYITLYCYVDSFIIGDDSLEDKNFINKVKVESIKKVSETTKSAIDKLQHTYKADLLRIKDDLYKYHKKDYEKVMDKYDEVFEAADINVHYNMKIKSVGLVK